MTFIISNSAMTNPGDAPYIPSVARNLYMNFNAKLDAPNNGAVIESLVFRGSAPILDRTFNKKRGNVLTFPKSIGGSTPYIQFDGTNTLANSNDNGGTGSYKTIENNITIAFRLRVNDWSYPSGGTAGFIRGVSNRTASVRQGSTNTEGLITIAGGLPVAKTINEQTDLKTGQWGVLIISYSSTESNILLAGSGSTKAFAMEAGTSLQGFGFGSTNAAAATAASNFDLSHFAIWDRSLSADEMILARDIWEAGGDFQL